MPRSAKEANNPILLKVQSLQLSFRPAGVSLGGGGGGAKAPPGPPPCVRPWLNGPSCSVLGTNDLTRGPLLKLPPYTAVGKQQRAKL